MDKFFPPHQDIPVLSKERFDQMTELALSHPQHAPGNQNIKGRWTLPWSVKWASALSAAACVVLMIGVMSVQTPPELNITPAKTDAGQMAQSDDAYSDITELAILDMIDTY